MERKTLLKYLNEKYVQTTPDEAEPSIAGTDKVAWKVQTHRWKTNNRQ